VFLSVFVSYRETVTGISSMTALSKSSNKHNRLYVTAQPLYEEVAKDIESGKISSRRFQGPRSCPR